MKVCRLTRLLALERLKRIAGKIRLPKGRATVFDDEATKPYVMGAGGAY